MSDTRKSGAWLVRHALEQLPISFTFGIPGVHVTEIYDELGKSEKIRPILVTHEAGAAFMADAISRTSSGQIGTLVVVPAAGITHAMSGIGEAFLDGIPLLVISGGTRTDVSQGFQLHELDQMKLVAGLTKRAWKVSSHDEIVSTLFEAYHCAISGFPGPVLVEIPANLQLFLGPVGPLPALSPLEPPTSPLSSKIEEAVRLFRHAKSPGFFVGWGAVHATEEIRLLAEWLGAPVATTLQGMSTFPGSHPLHTGMGFSSASVPASQRTFADCDCLIAVGTRFGEIPTGSFSCKVPENLIHIDIDPRAIDRNYKAKVALIGDSQSILRQLLDALKNEKSPHEERRARVAQTIFELKAKHREEWKAHKTDRVNPGTFFTELRKQLSDRALMVVDDGNHTFLAAELFEVRTERGFISPTDFNCMGYCVPAAIGAKLANP